MHPSNIKPVTGMSPQVIATQLRALLRAMLIQGTSGGYQSIKSTQSYTKSAKKHLALARAMEKDVWARFADLEVAITNRRAAQGRAILNAMRSDMTTLNVRLSDVQAFVTNADQHASKIALGGNADKRLQQAYAYAQALPTAENSPVGGSENALRAIIAILRIHMPDEIGNITQAEIALKDAKPIVDQVKTQYVDVVDTGEQEEEEEEEYEVVAEQEPEAMTILDGVPDKIPGYIYVESHHPGPYTIQGPNGYLLTNQQIETWAGGGKPDFASLSGYGLKHVWNQGNCSLASAYKTLLWIRASYSDKEFALRDTHGKTFITAKPKEYAVLHMEVPSGQEEHGDDPEVAGVEGQPGTNEGTTPVPF